MRRALFLDRDGVVNVEKNYVYQINQFEFIDGIFDACALFQKREYLLIIITNQAGIARGLYTEKDYKILTDWMLAEFRKHNVEISNVYHCPHHPDFTGSCACRKPEPGMLLQAAKDFNLDMANSILVGDKKSDMLAAKTAGITNRVLVRSGHTILQDDGLAASFVIESISDLKNIYR